METASPQTELVMIRSEVQASASTATSLRRLVPPNAAAISDRQQPSSSLRAPAGALTCLRTETERTRV